MGSKQNHLFIFLFSIFSISFNAMVNAQNGQLIGIVDNNLVEINPLNGNLTQYTAVDAPIGTTISKLAFSTVNCIFYGIINGSNNPILISIDWEGNYSEIGLLTLLGSPVYICEGLSYNKTDNKLYGAVSLNGGVANNDFFSEAIVEVNPTNAVVTLITNLQPGSTTQTDIDGMGFIGNTLFIHDGSPGSQFTSVIYKLDFQGLGATTIPTEIYSTNYHPIRDFTSIGNKLYWTTSDLGFYELDAGLINYKYIGQTHAAPVFNGQPINGLEYVETEELPVLNIDTTICTGEELTVVINLNNAIVKWNTGTIGNSLTIDNAGLYWADIQVGNCKYISDTAFVGFDQPVADLGPDLSICEGESIILSSFQNGVTYLWQDGSNGPIYQATEQGWYSIEMMIGNCSDIDSLFLEINPSPLVNFGADTIICPNSTFSLNAYFDGATYLWNNGSSLSSLPIDQPGSYSVEVNLNGCIAIDEIEVGIATLITDINIGTDTTLCSGFNILLNSNAENANEYIWSNGEFGNSIVVDEPGNYFVTASNECGPVTSNIIRLAFEDCDCYFWAPNVFSPNDDGINDFFHPFTGCEALQYELKVFDRWGDFVFVSNDLNIGWDGTFRGQKAVNGAYAFFINAVLLNKGGIEKKIQLEGDLTLIR